MAEVGRVVGRDPADVDGARAPSGVAVTRPPGAVSWSRDGGPAGQRRDLRGRPAAHGPQPNGMRSSGLRTAARGSPASGRAARASGPSPAAGRQRRSRASISRPVTSVSQLLAQRPVEGLRGPGRATVSSSSSQRLAEPAPQHGAQLGLVVEGQAVVDAVAVPVGHRQHVAALAVGVVHDRVEDGHPAQRAGVLVHQRHRLVEAVDAVEDVPPALRHRALGDDVDRGLLLVGLAATAAPCRDRAGRRAGTCGGTTSQPVATDTAYAATSRNGERAVGEVPQRPLPRDRLVDHAGRRRSRRRRWRWTPA